MSRFAFVFNEDLPEVTEGSFGTLEIDGEAYGIDGVWKTPARWRQQALNYLAIAEYLDNLKPKLPTEPGSVILATNTGFGTKTPGGEVYLVLDSFGKWNALDGLLTGIPIGHIEDWKPVQLTVVEVSS